jgi:DNA-binding winged helix-turn-helix (wHTH) protein
MVHEIVRFSEFCFHPATGRLTRNGVPIPLENQPALLLAQLIRSPGELIGREQLAAAIWQDGTHVKFDDGLNYCVRQVRAALGDDSRSPRYIETIPRRGYRFVAATTPVPVSARSPVRRLVLGAAAMTAVALIVVIESRPNNHHQVAMAVARAVHDVIF